MRFLPILFATVSTILLAPSATAQTRCPGGVAAGSAQCLPDDDDAPSRPTGEWIKTWGALVSSNQANGAWSSKQQLSEEAAKNDALARCQSNGASDCRVDKTYFNQCVGVAVIGSNERGVFFNTGKSEAVARKEAVKYCERESGKQCKPMFAECSKPLFRRY